MACSSIFWVSHMYNKDGSQVQVAWKIFHWLPAGGRAPKVIKAGQEHSVGKIQKSLFSFIS